MQGKKWEYSKLLSMHVVVHVQHHHFSLPSSFFFLLWLMRKRERERGKKGRESAREKYVIRPLCGFFLTHHSYALLIDSFLSDQFFFLLSPSFFCVCISQGIRLCKRSLFDARETSDNKEDFYGLIFSLWFPRLSKFFYANHFEYFILTRD